MKRSVIIILLLIVQTSIVHGQLTGDGPLGPSSQLCNSTYKLNPFWYDEPYKLFTVCDSVLVGIGTQFPEFKLHVEGTTFGQNILMGNHNASTSALFNGFANANRPSLMKLGLKIGNQADQVLFNFTGDGTFKINNTSGPAIVVYGSSGTKIMQLEDDGLLRSRGVRVDSDNWADYVFKSSYTLPKLEDVKRYIDKHHHLPNIPSADNIKTNGLDLAEISRLQMEKIEELTLYTIDQEEKIKALEKRLAELEKLIK